MKICQQNYGFFGKWLYVDKFLTFLNKKNVAAISENIQFMYSEDLFLLKHKFPPNQKMISDKGIKFTEN